MSTRSTIAMKYDDGKIRKVYCHFDGYPEGVGSTLNTFYNDADIIDRLLSKGNMSFLESKIDNCKFYDEPCNEYPTFTDYCSSQMQQYNYIFKDGKWHVYNEGFRELVLQPDT